MPYNSYRFSCEHVLLKRLSFLSKLSIILNCHRKKGYFLSMGEGVSAKPLLAGLGTHLHTQRHADANKHTHAHTCVCTMPTPSCPSASTLPQPRHRAGHTWEGKESQCQIRIVTGAERRQSPFPPHRQVDVCGKCSVSWQSSASSFLSSNSVFIV